MDRARVAAHQKGAVNTRAWIVFLDESGVSLLPQIRRTYAPRGRTPLLRHRLNWKRASMAGALGYHSTDPDRGARLCFHLKPGSYDTAALIEVLEQMKTFYRGEQVVLVWGRPVGPLEPGDEGLGRRAGLAHSGAITRLRSRAEPGGTAVVLAQEA
ncbi:transposase [Streptomyces sp. SLBN-115]|uniref:transposase n=1 Tax=Streptomyces sp. SLBN-115 TaxID=2768453 RepID=UPI002E10B097